MDFYKSLLKSSEEVTLTVATTSQLPASVVVAQTYSWVTPDGRPTSPPPEYNPRLHHHQVSRVEVEVVGSESLGLMIRGGVEYGLGIFITGVDQDSAAYKAGLEIGDQILEVNGESFLAVTHDTAVNVLKYSRRLRLALRRVAKMPHSCTTYDRRCWPPPTRSNGENSAENMEATLAMIEEKSQRVLTRGQHGRLKEVVGDYAAGRIPVEHLLAISSDILDSPDKLSLLTELREVVRVEDQDKFDDAVFRYSARAPDKPLRRHSHTGEFNGTTGGKPQAKAFHTSHHASRSSSSSSSHAHPRKQYEGYDTSASSRAREEYDGSRPSLPRGREDIPLSLLPRGREDIPLPSLPRGREEYDTSRVRDDFDQSREMEDYDPSSRGRDDYDPTSRGREEYDESSYRGREDYDPSSRGRDEYEPSSRGRSDYASPHRGRETYESSTRGREQFEQLPTTRVRQEYDPSATRVREPYDSSPAVHLRDDYSQTPPSRGHGEYDPGSEAYGTAPRSSSRDDYSPILAREREVFEGSPSRSRLAVDHHRPGCSGTGVTSGGSSPVAARRSSTDEREDTHTPYACSRRRTSLVVSDSMGRFRVVVKKTRPNLGIAIEGGADTKQKLPRVINIAANGAAFEAGGLRVGQLILAVDGQQLDGQSHEEAARLIAGCWVSRSRPEVEFMVVERKPTPADVRRSSISLLSQM